MKCPGQDSRYWKPGAIFEVKCPRCGGDVEFFRDDTTRVCKGCGHRFLNPHMDFGCASYCAYAEQCIGNMPPELIAQKEDLLKDRVAIEMKRHFRRDFRRIGHSIRVARHAEALAGQEGGNLAVVLVAAFLHDLDAGTGETAGEGSTGLPPSVAKTAPVREILGRLGARPDLIEAVCDIIPRIGHPETNAGIDVRILHDADLIAGLEERAKQEGADRGALAGEAADALLTASGRDLALRILNTGGEP